MRATNPTPAASLQAASAAAPCSPVRRPAAGYAVCN